MFSHIIYIDSVCVDELESVQDVCVNKIFLETMIDDSVTENDQHKNNIDNINDVSSRNYFNIRF